MARLFQLLRSGSGGGRDRPSNGRRRKPGPRVRLLRRPSPSPRPSLPQRNLHRLTRLLSSHLLRLWMWTGGASLGGGRAVRAGFFLWPLLRCAGAWAVWLHVLRCGAYFCVYRCVLNNTSVAVKVLKDYRSDFERGVPPRHRGASRRLEGTGDSQGTNP